VSTRKRAKDEKTMKKSGREVAASTNAVMRKTVRHARNDTGGNASIGETMVRMKSEGEDEREIVEMTTIPVKMMIANEEIMIVDERTRKRVVAAIVTRNENIRTRKRRRIKRTRREKQSVLTSPRCNHWVQLWGENQTS
jgi:hypothetical protein